MKERFQENKLKGFRKVAGTAVLAVSLAACGSNNATETQKPTILPTESPTPSLMVSPTPEASPVATPTQTPEATPSPTPEATPMPIANLFEGEHPKPAIKEVIADIKSAVENNPKSVDENRTLGKMLKLWEYCQKGDPMLGGNLNSNREANCEILIGTFYQTYQEFKDENFYNLAKDVYNYTVNTLPKEYIKGMNKNLEEIF